MSSGIDVAVVSSVPELEALGPDWRALQDACAHQHVMSDHRWILAWWRHFGSRARQHTLVLSRGGRPVGILPLAVTRGMEQFPFRDPYVTMPEDYRHLPYLRLRRLAPVRRLTFPLGIASGNLRGQAIFPDDGCSLLRSAASHVAGTAGAWDVAVWPGLRATEGEDSELADAAGAAGLRVGSRRTVRPMLKIDLPTSFDDFLKARSAHFRKRMQQECNKVARTFAHLGEMAVRAYRGSEIGAGLDILFALERLSWKVHDDKDRRLHLTLDDPACGFFREVAERFAAEDQAQVLTLRFGETPAAAFLTLERADVTACILTYRNETLGNSVAIAPIWRALVSRSIDQGIRRIDINGYARNYMKWAKDKEDYVQLLLYNRRPYSRLLHAADEGAISLRHWIKDRSGWIGKPADGAPDSRKSVEETNANEGGPALARSHSR